MFVLWDRKWPEKDMGYCKQRNGFHVPEYAAVPQTADYCQCYGRLSVSPCSQERGMGEKIEAKAMDALEFAGISDMAKENASVLSQGDLKRLEVARAIATEPELLLLDEPFGGLSPAETDLMAKSIKRLHKGGRFGRLHSEGPAMIIVEHKLQWLMMIATRIIVLSFGTVIADGPPEEIIKNPTVVEAYLGQGGN